MALLQEIEKRLENLFEGFFNRQFKSALQPIELAKRLVKEMDRSKTISIDNVYVANEYTIHLSGPDFQKINAINETLAAELKGYLHTHAELKKYTLSPRVKIFFRRDESLGLGEFKITAALVDEIEPPEQSEFKAGHTQIISPTEAAELGFYAGLQNAALINMDTGKRHPITGTTVFIGRNIDNDIVVNDPSVSRRHARLDRDGPSFSITDLNSTNGITVNEKPVVKAFLEDEDCLTLGKTKFIFRSR